MPVNSTSWLVVRSSNLGGSRWMGRAFSLSISSMPSMDSPVTFITRPRICAPTGMAMGRQVFFTSRPRLRPSVESMATQRTVSSPMCCCTSNTSSFPSGRVTTRASSIRGSSSSALRADILKCTSTTGPTTCAMCPTAWGISYIFSVSTKIQFSSQILKFSCPSPFKRDLWDNPFAPKSTLLASP